MQIISNKNYLTSENKLINKKLKNNNKNYNNN